MTNPALPGKHGAVYGYPRIVEDARLLGMSERVLVDNRAEELELMIVPPVFLECVVFIGYEDKDGNRYPCGTGFLMSRIRDDVVFRYLITARHIIDAITGGKIKNVNKRRVLIRVNLEGGKSDWIITAPKSWILGDKNPRYVDVALRRFDLESNYDHRSLSYEILKLGWDISDGDPILSPFIKASGVPFNKLFGLGDEVFCPGLFYPYEGTERNTPVVRIGNIAAMLNADAPVSTEHGLMDAYLIDGRSLHGQSGAPVFVNIDKTTVKDLIPSFLSKLSRVTVHVGEDGEKFRREAPFFIFLGLLYGFFPFNLKNPAESINAGLSVVVPAYRICDLLESSNIVEEEINQVREMKIEISATPANS